MSEFEQYLIESFGETWERGGIMDAHNAAVKEAYQKGWKEGYLKDKSYILSAAQDAAATTTVEKLNQAAEKGWDELAGALADRPKPTEEQLKERK